MTTELATSDSATPVPAIPLEIRQFVLDSIDHVAATARLAIESGLSLRGLARRSALVTLTGVEDEGKPVVLVTTESEDILRKVVSTMRSPMVVRYKTMERSPTAPSLPEPTTEPGATSEPATENESLSSNQEEKAES